MAPRRRSPRTRACARSIWARSAMAETLLALREVRAGYGDSVVLDNVTLEVPAHGSVAVLGRNGVGKSTLLLTVMGYTSLSRGAIVWRGEEKQMLAMARSRMTNPSLLLLDEPLEGLAPIIIEQLTAAIRRMALEEGTAIILVEQHADIALALTEDAIVLERGPIVHRSGSRELLDNHALLDRFIGLKLAESADTP